MGGATVGDGVPGRRPQGGRPSDGARHRGRRHRRRCRRIRRSIQGGQDAGGVKAMGPRRDVRERIAIPRV